MLFVVVAVFARALLHVTQHTCLEALAVELQALGPRAVAPLLLLVRCVLLVFRRRRSIPPTHAFKDKTKRVRATFGRCCSRWAATIAFLGGGEGSHFAIFGLGFIWFLNMSFLDATSLTSVSGASRSASGSCSACCLEGVGSSLGTCFQSPPSGGPNVYCSRGVLRKQ